MMLKSGLLERYLEVVGAQLIDVWSKSGFRFVPETELQKKLVFS